jgi:uncharacterized protein YndB with AHSA1/START domain
MATGENWPGFRASPKADVNLVKSVVSKEISIKKPLADVLLFFTSSNQMGSWLSPIAKLDARAGGHVEFKAEKGFEHGGAYSTIQIPSRIVLVTEKFGEIDAKFTEDGAKSKVHFTFSKLVLPEDQDAFQKQTGEAITRFIAMVNY